MFFCSVFAMCLCTLFARSRTRAPVTVQKFRPARTPRQDAHPFRHSKPVPQPTATTLFVAVSLCEQRAAKRSYEASRKTSATVPLLLILIRRHEMPPRNETAALACAENSTLYVAIEISRKSWVVGIKSPVNDRIGLHTIESEVPDPALDHHPQPGLAHPRPHPPAPAPGLGRALQHNARAHRDLRRNAAIHRRLIQGIGLDPCRNHPGARVL